jgi:hypothetical protein
MNNNRGPNFVPATVQPLPKPQNRGSVTNTRTVLDPRINEVLSHVRFTNKALSEIATFLDNNNNSKIESRLDKIEAAYELQQKRLDEIFEHVKSVTCKEPDNSTEEKTKKTKKKKHKKKKTKKKKDDEAEAEEDDVEDINFDELNINEDLDEEDADDVSFE